MRLADQFVRLFLARLRRLVWLRGMAERFAPELLPEIEKAITSTAADLEALGAGEEAARMVKG